MKSNDHNAVRSEPLIEPILGQILSPVTAQAFETQKTFESDNECAPRSSPSYRLEKLISQQAGKKIFLAIDTHSKKRVVVELVLFDPNPLKETLPPVDESRPQFRRANASPDSTPALEKQPYLNSFKVKTSMGLGFAIVKPYLEEVLPVNSKEKHVVELTDTVSLHSATEPYQLTLSSPPYRRSYTRTPQMSFKDFQVRATSNKLEIHCAQHRIRENLEEQHISPLDELALGALTVISTIVLVGGSVAFSGSILLGILIAAALPIPLRLMSAQPPRVTSRKAILRLTKSSQESQESQGSKSSSKYRALLSLATLPIQKRPVRRRKLSAWGCSSSAVLPTESKLHFSQVTVSAVKLSPVLSLSSQAGFLCYQISFLMSDRHHPNYKQLRITGTYLEIKWLSRHLSQWGNLQNQAGADIPGFLIAGGLRKVHSRFFG